MTWLLPTRGRPQNLRRFMRSAREMGTSSPGIVIIDADDWRVNESEYLAIKGLFPPQWDYLQIEPCGYGGALRSVWDRVKDLPWVGLVSDDLVPCTMNWDRALIEALAGWNFVSAMNGTQDQRMHGATVWSGDLLRAVGWIFPPKLRHVFHDDVWETIGREAGNWRVLPNVMTKHLHEAYLTGHRGPTMNPDSDLFRHDRAVFEKWMAEDKDHCVAAAKSVMERYGVVALHPDFAGVKLMIGTPSIDGKYESAYLSSLYHSLQFLKGQGVDAIVAEEKFTADVALARNKIFSSFVRSDCSHLLTIDADMGWTNDAIMRLFICREDFFAVAGPKKRYPLQFAASHTDAKGNPIALVVDPQRNAMEVSEVGSAFACISRACAEKMVAAYPELEYVGVTGEREWSVYGPMVEARRYYSEDFAFCKRWRAIGGKVWMLPDVRLSHTGSHAFIGSFMEYVAQQHAIQQEAARLAAE